MSRLLTPCRSLLSRDDWFVSKNALRGGNKATLPKGVLEPLPLAGASFWLRTEE